MTNVHIFGNVGRREIDQNALLFVGDLNLFRLFFFLLLLFSFSCDSLLLECGFSIDSFLEANSLAHIDALNLLLDEILSQVDVEEEAGLGRVTVASLRQFNLLDDVVLRLNVLDNGIGHGLTVLEAKRSLLLVHVVELHCGGANVVPGLVLFESDRDGVGEFGHGALSSTLQNLG